MAKQRYGTAWNCLAWQVLDAGAHRGYNPPMSILRRDIGPNGVLFVHIPKCAGSAMEQRPWLGGGGHNNITAMRKKFIGHLGVNGWHDLLKFTFVRNPWDRFVSVYFKWPPTKDNPHGFKDFVMGKFRNTGFNIPVMRQNKWSLHHHFLPQHTFVCYDGLGKLGVDFVGRVENVQDDWVELQNRLGLKPNPLPSVNVGNHMDYREYYDRDTIEVIAEMYQRDIELFGYEFD